MTARLLIIPIVALAALIAVLAPSAHVHACSCLPVVDPVDEFGYSDFVFTGTATEVIEIPDETPAYSFARLYVFNVDTVWKGPRGSLAYITTSRSGASCGANFTVGESYLVYANVYSRAGGYITGLCYRNTYLSHAAGDIEAFPVEGRPPNTERTGVLSPVLWDLVGLAPEERAAQIPELPSEPFPVGMILMIVGAALAGTALGWILGKRF